MRVVCAMSGGVDSSVAAAVLLEQGHEVVGMTMRLYDADPRVRTGKGGSCCSPAEVDLARAACAKLGIAHYVVDERERFSSRVIDDFVAAYASGRTPNPCTRCNQHIKFEPLMQRARALGAERLATGHYARNAAGRLLRARDSTKDQSYFLFAMGANMLRDVLFPLGEWQKDDVRARARALGLPNADAADSQELCFVPGGDHAEVVEQRMRERGLDLGVLQSGPIVDEHGQQVGEHGGIHRVTVGQRRGLRVAGTDRRYVLRVVPETRTVVVGDVEQAVLRNIEIGELQRLRLPSEPEFVAHVQIRHRGAAHPGRVRCAHDRAEVVFDELVPASAPGQAAVLYVGDEVVGGGWIERVLD